MHHLFRNVSASILICITGIGLYTLLETRISEKARSNGQEKVSQKEMPDIHRTPEKAGTHVSKSLPSEIVPEEDIPLEPVAQKEFFAELETVFLSKATQTLDPDALTPLVMQLNLRGRRGVRTILNALIALPQNDAEISVRLAMVDYLRYRMKWDHRLQQEVYNLALTKVDEKGPSKYRAAAMADRAELINGLARINWSLASKAIANLASEKAKDLASYEAYHGLLEAGVAKNDAIASVQTANPHFVAR